MVVGDKPIATLLLILVLITVGAALVGTDLFMVVIGITGIGAGTIGVGTTGDSMILFGALTTAVFMPVSMEAAGTVLIMGLPIIISTTETRITAAEIFPITLAEEAAMYLTMQQEIAGIALALPHQGTALLEGAVL